MSATEALKAARRVAGFAGMGVCPSQVNARNVLRQLDREIGDDKLPEARKLLGDLATTNVLPSQKVCHQAYTEINTSLETMKRNQRVQDRSAQSQVDSQVDGDEEDHPAPRG
jgi:hypothetical protein